MKIKIPQKIKLGIHEYQIRYNSVLWHEEALKGSANHLKEVIDIDPHLAPNQKIVTLLHEINHIINDQYSCKLDEAEINSMAEGMAELLIDNLFIEFDWSTIKDIK